MAMGLETQAVVLSGPKSLALQTIALDSPRAGDLVVEISASGVSTGTEKLIWNGSMPQFPGMGYPLVPGYEAAGEVVDAGSSADFQAGDMVFVPGATCYGEVKGLFGAAASRIVIPAHRALKIDRGLGDAGVLLALAATSYHAIAPATGSVPDLIVGHGVVGRLMARIAIAFGHPVPIVWETDASRRDGNNAYSVIDPADDDRRDYRCIVDASGDANLLDTLLGRLTKGGELVLAGFYSERLSFAYPAAFMREARMRIAAEWRPDDLIATRTLVDGARLSLDGLITHHRPAGQAKAAYQTAFNDRTCLKMVLDWGAQA